MTRHLVIPATVVGLLMGSGLLNAHHGNAAYETDRSITLTGVVTDFRFVNPHVQIYFDVARENGEVEKWSAQLTAPTKLSRGGWTRRTLQPGDQITLTGAPGVNEGRSVWIRELIGPDGDKLRLGEEWD